MSAIQQIRDNVNKMLDTLDPQSPISATVVFKVKAEEERTMKKNLETLSKATLKLPGVVVFIYKRHRPFKGEPGENPKAVEYLIFEDWETVEQFRAQWNSKHLHKFQDGVFELLTESPDVTFYKGYSGDSGDGSGAVQLQQTGQTRCYDTSGEKIDCEGTGQDGDYRAGEPLPDPRFTDNDDGTVTDNLTGLVWLKDANLFGELPSDQAIEYARGLANGQHGLRDGSKPGDWRLPNVNELQSLYLNNASGAALQPEHPFVNSSLPTTGRPRRSRPSRRSAGTSPRPSARRSST